MENWLNWYYSRYHRHGNARFLSFLYAMTWLGDHTDSSRVIVETGTQRQDDDLGAGESTRIFARFCWECHGKLISIDNEIGHIRRSRECISHGKDHIQYIHDDSVKGIVSLDTKINLLYLDSLDYLDGWQSESENHCLREAEVALPKMASNSLILIDDFNEQGIGKGRLARGFLIEEGWVEFFRQQQGIYIRHENFS